MSEETTLSLDERAKHRIEELDSEIQEVESLIDRTKEQLRKLQEAHLVKLGELSGLKKLIGD